ncbi:hypothetical protein CFK41_14735 [Brachybacterium ginsengisoli]|uniref:Uncharacterized protein n=1 Tax=Brachybacterium ginsengisoli TaxID=1331682 RepID=A0A291H0B7_9MICO|nr:hypothetical protein [Brachybacterium ginsengisoli]ATG55895.1 hypothetical protein CFK41_14735 [Brachybacterium ginsengisoli]
MSTTPQQPSPPPAPATSSAASAASAPTADGPALPSNPLGTASFVAAILMFLWRLASQALWPLAPDVLQRINLPYWMFNLILQAPSALLALVATVLGIVALTQKGRRRTMAIIGTTLGVSALVNLVAGWMVTFLSSALFY